MSGMVDTHAHLCDPAFEADLAQVLERAAGAGVAAVVAVAETMADAERNLQLASQFPMVRPAAALYPTILDAEEAGRVQQFIRTHRGSLVAIGETGLDHWRVQDDAGRGLQREIFAGFVRLAGELDLPLNVHSRSAGRHAIELLLDLGAARVHMHAFDGKPSSALPAVEAGFFFSIPPSIARSQQKQKLVRRLPLSCLLVETDSPVLGPAANERNEPANVRVAIEAIAQIKHVAEQEVADVVRANTRRLYNLP
jgi:TatD DNase family protein